MPEPFRPVPPPRRRWWERLLFRKPRGQVYVELVRRLAAAEDVTHVTAEDITELREKYRVDPLIRFEPQLRGLYRNYLSHCLADRKLDEKEVLALEHLKRLFRLPDAVVERIHEQVARNVYNRSVAEAIADGRLTAEEREFLRQVQDRLRLPDHVARRIYDDEARGRLRETFEAAAVDARLSDQEHEELRAMARSFGVDSAFDDPTRQLYERLRLYWLIENGELRTLPCDLTLDRGEGCLATREVIWYELTGPAPRRRGPTDRAAAATSLQLRPPAIGPLQLPSAGGRRIDAGRLYLTTQRLVLSGRSRRMELRLEELLDFRPFTNGIMLQLDRGAAPFVEFQDEVDVFALKLDRALREALRPAEPSVSTAG